jgi:hypothetical protein
MPLEYHLVDTARQIFRLGKRRDAAATIPRPTGEAMQYIVQRDKDYPPNGFDDTTWALEKEQKLKELWYPTFLEDAMICIQTTSMSHSKQYVFNPMRSSGLH